MAVSLNILAAAAKAIQGMYTDRHAARSNPHAAEMLQREPEAARDAGPACILDQLGTRQKAPRPTDISKNGKE